MAGTRLALDKEMHPETPPVHGRRRFRAFVLEEVRSLVPAWLFFLALFVLLRLMRVEILLENHIRTLPPSRVLLGSIVVAKGILLMDLLPFVKTVERRPVVPAALFKTLCAFVIVFGFEFLDGVLELRREGFIPATAEFGRRLSTISFWIMQTWLLVLLFSYSATRELSAKLGPTRFRELMFGRRPPA